MPKTAATKPARLIAKYPPLPKTLTPYPVVANIDFAEGPIFDDAGNLYFVDYLVNGTIGRMSPDGTAEVWAHTGGRANGLKYDGDGHIVAADFGAKRVTRFNTRTREMEVLTADFRGRPYHGVNDVCLDLKGNVYFTDPGDNERKSIGGIYRINVDRKNRVTTVDQLDTGQPYPNGPAVHPDQKRLFVAMSGAQSIVCYDIAADGKVKNRRNVFEFPTWTVDGIQFDEHGRLWVARWEHGTMDVIDVDERKLLASYPMGGKQVTNLCWHGTSLYVTVASRHSIERLDVGCGGADIVPKWSR